MAFGYVNSRRIEMINDVAVDVLLELTQARRADVETVEAALRNPHFHPKFG